MSGPARHRPGDDLSQPPGGPPAGPPGPAGHPDPERLAAYAAGEDLDAGTASAVAEHVSACAVCAADVDALNALGAGLAALEEPDLPAGLHDRIAAAVAAETAAVAPTGAPAAAEEVAPVRPFPQPAERAARRARRRRRIGGLVAAAAAVLLIGVVLVGWPGALDTVTSGGESVLGIGEGDQDDAGGAAEAESAAPAPMVAETDEPDAGEDSSSGQVPEYSEAGEYGAADVPRTLDDRPEAREAYEAATADEAAGEDGAADEAPETAEAPAEEQAAGSDDPKRDVTKDSAPETADDEESAEEPETFDGPPPTTLATERSSANEQCLERVRADGRQPLYVVEAEHEGEQATVVAAAERGQPDQVWLYTFPGRDCTAEPVVERAPVTR